MFNREIYKIWAPTNKRWVDWARPVAFIGIDPLKDIHDFIDYEIPTVNYIKKKDKHTAVFIDIDGVDSIKEGIALARLGFRPIPLFNGTNPNNLGVAATDNEVIEELLIWGAEELKEIELEDDAPPIFLLDDNRLNNHKADRGVFDNSWDIYHQDLPTYRYLKKCGIKRVIVRGPKLYPDLKRVLYNYYAHDIEVLFTNGYDEPKSIKIRRPRFIDFN